MAFKRTGMRAASMIRDTERIPLEKLKAEMVRDVLHLWSRGSLSLFVGILMCSARGRLERAWGPRF